MYYKNIHTILLVATMLLTFVQNNFATEGVYDAPKTSSIPVIDGIGNDDCWEDAPWAPIDNIWIGNAVSETDYSGKFKAVWTADYIYLLVELTDDSLHCQPVFDMSNIYNYDCLEVFIDEDHSGGIYSGTYEAFAYHMDTTGHVCYAKGSYGWERLDDHVTMKMGSTGQYSYQWELRIKVFNDSFDPSASVDPVVLTEGKLMGWSVAYNDNDAGTTRQNMFGSKYIEGEDKNISYYNASALGVINLVAGTDTIPSAVNDLENDRSPNSTMNCTAYNCDEQLRIRFEDPSADNLLVEVYNLQGSLVSSEQVNKPQYAFEYEVNTDRVPDGIYFLKIEGNIGSYTAKIAFIQ